MNYQEFFSLAKKKGIEKIQITEETEKENSIYLIGEKLEDYTDSEKCVYSIKAEINGKTEKVVTEYLDENIIDLLIEKITETDSNYQDDYLSGNKKIMINDVENTDITKEVPKIYELQKLAKNYHYTKSLEIMYSDYYAKTRIVNSSGVDIATSSHNYQLYAEASAQKEDNISSYGESVLVNDKKTLDFNQMVKSVLELASIATTKRNRLTSSSEKSSQRLQTRK